MLALAENTALMGGQRVSPQLKCFKMLLNSAGGVSFFFFINSPPTYGDTDISTESRYWSLCWYTGFIFHPDSVFVR